VINAVTSKRINSSIVSGNSALYAKRNHNSYCPLQRNFTKWQTLANLHKIARDII